MKSDWIEATIEDVCELVTDGAHNSPKSVDNGEYMASVKDFTEFGFDFSKCRKISESDYKKLEKQGCVPQLEDVLIGKDGARYFEDIIIYRQKEKPALLSSIAILRADRNKITPEFLYYTLRSPLVRKDVRDNYGSGSAIPRVVLKDFKRMPFVYPPIEKQKKITKICETIDEKIQVNKKINENLYEQATAYYKYLFSETPLTATVGELSENIFSGGTPSTKNDAYWNGSHYWLSSGETSSRFVISTQKTITDDGINNSSTRKANQYDIVIASAGQGHTRGQTSMLLTDSYVNQSIIVVHATPEYLPFLFWNIANRYEELRVISNSNSIRGSLTTKMINSLEVPLAEKSTVMKFSEYAWPIIHIVENNLKENHRLSMIRDTLLPRFMSGEMDVSSLNI